MAHFCQISFTLSIMDVLVYEFAKQALAKAMASVLAGAPAADTAPRTWPGEVLFGRQSASRSVTRAGNAPQDATFHRVTPATQTPPSP
jgi:hypothetical protein